MLRTDGQTHRRTENPAMTLQDIKETKRYGRMDRHTHARTDNVKTVYPTRNKVCGGYKESEKQHFLGKPFFAATCWYFKIYNWGHRK